MNKLNAIVQNPSLEEHIIFFVGIRHMEKHWEQHIDYQIPYSWDILEMFYREMKQSTLQGLKDLLRQDHGISDKDSDFKSTMNAAIGIIIARHGMPAIVANAREFLRVLTAAEIGNETHQFSFIPPAQFCGSCGQLAISCGLEDVPATRSNKHFSLETQFGYCMHCKTFFRVQ